MIRWTGKQSNLPMSYLQRLWMLIYPWLVYEGLSTVISMALLMLLVLKDPGTFLGSAGKVYEQYAQIMNAIYEYYLYIALMTCLFSIPLLLLFMHLDREKEVKLGMVRETWSKPKPSEFALCFFCGVSVCVVFNHLLSYSGLYDLLENSFEPVAELLFVGDFWLELVAVGILTPIAEELIFRGLMYRRMRWYLDAKWAAVMSAMIFAVIHGNLLQGIYAFGIGLLMAFVYERYHHILAPVLIHVGANIVSVALTDSGYFDFIYETDAAFFAATGLMIAVFVAVFYLILTKVQPERLDGKPETEPAGFQGTF